MPLPTPTIIRPRLMLSMRAICSANLIGWCNAIWATAKPILILLVRAAMAEAKVMGST